MVTVKSPDVIFVIIPVIVFTGFITICVTRSIRIHNKIIHTTLMIIITVLRCTISERITLLGRYDTSSQSVPSTSLKTVIFPSIVVESYFFAVTFSASCL